MNSTNRFANRLLLIVTGIVLLVAGAAALAVLLVSVVADWWDRNASSIREGTRSWADIFPQVGAGYSSAWIAIVIALAVAIIVFIVFIARQGQGHTSLLLTHEPAERSATTVSAGVAERLLEEALAERDDLASSSVSTYRVRRRPTLKVSVQVRRGVSPRFIASELDAAIEDLDALLGARVPVVVQIGSGLRSRMTKPARVV